MDVAKIDEIAEKAVALRPEVVGVSKADLSRATTNVI
jgi:hypothetical protein